MTASSRWGSCSRRGSCARATTSARSRTAVVPATRAISNVIDVTARSRRVSLDGRTRGARTRRGPLTTAACGVCGRLAIDDLLARCGAGRRRPARRARDARGVSRAMRARQTGFARTGGLHAAAAIARRRRGCSSPRGRRAAQRGRQGGRRAAASHARLPPAALLVVSGRSSFEIVQKAVMARVPIVASVSAASSLAIELAERFNIALAAFVRGETDERLQRCPERIVARRP